MGKIPPEFLQDINEFILTCPRCLTKSEITLTDLKKEPSWCPICGLDCRLPSEKEADNGCPKCRAGVKHTTHYKASDDEAAPDCLCGLFDPPGVHGPLCKASKPEAICPRHGAAGEFDYAPEQVCTCQSAPEADKEEQNEVHCHEFTTESANGADKDSG